MEVIKIAITNDMNVYKSNGNACTKCNSRLNDLGKCPKCDYNRIK